MASAALQVASILGAGKQESLNSVAQGLDQHELLWASGYLAGLAAGVESASMPGRTLADTQTGSLAAFATRAAATLGASAATGALTRTETTAQTALEAQPALRVAVLYASETGNSRRAAERFSEQLRTGGYDVFLQDLSVYPPRQLKRERQVVFVTATHGLGDPPEGAEGFFEYWHQDKAPRLEQLRYSVLALGDSSYDDFCQVGVDLDARLSALGAQRLYDRMDCDLDFEADAAIWSGHVSTAIEQLRPKPQTATPATPLPQLHAVADPHYSRDNPYMAELLTAQRITGRDSSKEVLHIELSLEDSGLSFLPGDSVGVWPTNPAALVTELLEATGLSAASAVQFADTEMSLSDALGRKLEITASSRAFVTAWAAAVNNKDLAGKAQEKGLKAWLYRHQIIDIVRAFPGNVTAQTLVDCLRGLTPRLYSIASSLESNPDEVHLTVGRVAYSAFGIEHGGTASGFLSGAPEQVPVFVERNDRFRLPGDPDTPIIMIGAGTGVAPYRAFLQQRQQQGANGANWLVYGDRNLHSDFLYQVEMLRYRRDGLLHRLDVAFSRDQAEKRYVQHCLIEQGAEVYNWIQNGAHIYVCGDADHMAPDVHATLQDIVVSHGATDTSDADAFLNDLKRAGRYQRDVY